MSNLQSKLDVMKGWSAKRLAAAVPAWAKPNLMPAPFKPQLSQKLPNFCTRMLEQWTIATFRGYDKCKTTAEYVARWNTEHGYRATSLVDWNAPKEVPARATYSAQFKAKAFELKLAA